MNREIKFRAQDISSNKWLFGDLRHHKGDVFIFEHGSNIGEKIKPETIGQFTGLHDKNGKKIYGGDIVRYWREDTRCINPDCDSFNWIYESYIKKVEGVVSYEDGMFVSEDYTPLVWCGIEDLKELRDSLQVTEEDGWCDADGNIIDESKVGIEVIGNIHDNPELLNK